MQFLYFFVLERQSTPIVQNTCLFHRVEGSQLFGLKLNLLVCAEMDDEKAAWARKWAGQFNTRLQELPYVGQLRYCW